MEYSKAKIINGELVVDKIVEIDQNKLTSDCWLVQFTGLSACETCELKNTSECGGGETLKQLTAS